MEIARRQIYEISAVLLEKTIKDIAFCITIDNGDNVKSVQIINEQIGIESSFFFLFRDTVKDQTEANEQNAMETKVERTVPL